VCAYLDLEQDVNIDIGSTAVFFHDHAKPFLWSCLTVITASLVTLGNRAQLNMLSNCICVGGSFVSLALMITRVDLKRSPSLVWWFQNGPKWNGLSIAGVLLVEYLCVMGGGL
jgi:4-hydroxybenzoate polyprenyltransferase